MIKKKERKMTQKKGDETCHAPIFYERPCKKRNNNMKKKIQEEKRNPGATNE